MGMSMMSGSSSSYDTSNRMCTCNYSPVDTPKTPNPDPSNYIIKDYYENYGNLLVEIIYPDCKNYEGKKILVYKNATLEQLKKQKSIDPHFSNNKKFLSPFARFEPTHQGWNCAVDLLEAM